MIAVIDYGVGNLFSLTSSLKAVGADAVVSSSADFIRKSDKILLPGVGAFGDAMNGLVSAGLDKVVLDYIKTGKPLIYAKRLIKILQSMAI